MIRLIMIIAKYGRKLLIVVFSAIKIITLDIDEIDKYHKIKK